MLKVMLVPFRMNSVEVTPLTLLRLVMAAVSAGAARPALGAAISVVVPLREYGSISVSVTIESLKIGLTFLGFS